MPTLIETMEQLVSASERAAGAAGMVAEMINRAEDSARRITRLQPGPSLGIPIPGGRQAAGIIQPRASSDLADRMLGITVGASGR
jgi:hypothetical protein